MISQLPNPIIVNTPKGRATAVAIIDYGPDWDLQWITFLEESGECWTFANPEVRQEHHFIDEAPKPQGQVHPMRSDPYNHNLGLVIANEMRSAEFFEPGYHQPDHYGPHRNVI